MKILVTGALGFIGSHFCKLLLQEKQFIVAGFNRNSNQKNIKRIEDIKNNPNFQLIYGDLTKDIGGILEQIDVVVHFAASTFVDHSKREPEPFIQNNIIGAYKLLEEVRAYKDKIHRFIYIGSDEVYGPIISGEHTENSKLNPKNVYSASKAAAEMLVMSYYNTYGIPICITRMENVIGPFQHPQKVIPAFVKKALHNENLLVYGDGQHSRMWLYVEDACRAIRIVMEDGIPGEIYNIAAGQELKNINLAKHVLRLCNKPENNIEFIDDSIIRPGHDRRYAINADKVKSLGWEPKYDLEPTLNLSIQWYIDNQWWLN